jgi:hypothetical protein
MKPEAETPPVTLAELEKLSADYDGECAKLEDLVAALEADMELVRRQHIAGLKRQAAVVASREAALHSAIERAPHLFVKPNTVTINGVKQGFAYSPGSIVWDDDAQVVAKIREHRPKEFKTLVDVKESPRKAALKGLTADELNQLGCRIEGEGDDVVLKRVAGDVEKMITKVIEKLVAAMTSDPKPKS